eukprot:21437-Heterococcus_DN1.PRE.1
MSFSAYGQATRYLKSRPQSASLPAQSASSSNRKLSLSEMTLAGAWAGFVQAPARQVIERVKSVMQVRERSSSTSSNGGSSVGRSSKAPYSWSGQCAYQLVKEEGLAMGCITRTKACESSVLLAFTIYYPAYEVCKQGLLTVTGKPLKDVGPLFALTAGGLAGTLQWLPPIYCLDVIKTKMQTARPGVYASISDALHKTLRMHIQEVLVGECVHDDSTTRADTSAQVLQLEHLMSY